MQQHFTYFWDQRMPYAVQLDIERRTGTVLERDRSQDKPLVYRGKRTGGKLELRFEAAMLNGVLYSLRMDAANNGPDEAKFLGWLKDMHVTKEPGEVEFATGEKYDSMVLATLEFEAKQAAKKEDPAAIAAAQKAVLDALRMGRKYRLAMGGPEGFYSIEIRMEGDLLVKREVGEEEKVQSFATHEEMLAFLRNYFLVDASKDRYPHKPPEVEIWKYIGYQLK